MLRFVFRSLFFAAGFLLGGELLRRWLETEGGKQPGAPPSTAKPAPDPEPTSAAAPEPAPPGPGREAEEPEFRSPAEPDQSGMSRAELYERAKELDVKGRSKMSKADLEKAVAQAEASA